MNALFRVRSARLTYNPTSMHIQAPIDFAYPWWLSYGHLAIAGFAAACLLLFHFLKWSRRFLIVPGLLLIWSLTAFAVAQLALNVNGRASLPTENFLRSGTGLVLDLGAGTGRSSLMVLEARPQVKLVALDLFGDSYEQHFGRDMTAQERLSANLKAAGVNERATIVKADMRKLPFEPATFDAIVSSFAIDHLGRDGASQALAEAARVVKPGGEFLMTILNNDVWSKFMFGPMLSHGGARDLSWWTTRVKTSGFEVIEAGTPPAMLYILAKRPAAM